MAQPTERPLNYVLIGLQGIGLSFLIGVGSFFLIQIIPIRLFLAGLIIAPIIFLAALALLIRGLIFGSDESPTNSVVSPGASPSGVCNLASVLNSGGEQTAEQLPTFFNRASAAEIVALARRLDTAPPEDSPKIASELNSATDSQHQLPAGSKKISFECPQCGRKLKVKAELAGKQGKCPACNHLVRIPVEA